MIEMDTTITEGKVTFKFTKPDDPEGIMISFQRASETSEMWVVNMPGWCILHVHREVVRDMSNALKFVLDDNQPGHHFAKKP